MQRSQIEHVIVRLRAVRPCGHECSATRDAHWAARELVKIVTDDKAELERAAKLERLVRALKLGAEFKTHEPLQQLCSDVAVKLHRIVEGQP